MAGGGGGAEKGEPEFQIAPMIDVLLVLLIFFMSITTAEVVRIDKSIVLPVAPDAAKKDKSSMGEGALNIRWGPEERRANKALFNFQGKDYPVTENLVTELQRLMNSVKDYHVIIRGDKDLPMSEMQRAMSVLGQAGVENIAFSALNQ